MLEQSKSVISWMASIDDDELASTKKRDKGKF